MLYQHSKFTLPAANTAMPQRSWDFAVMPKSEFLAKYGPDAPEYTNRLNGIVD